MTNKTREREGVEKLADIMSEISRDFKARSSEQCLPTLCSFQGRCLILPHISAVLTKLNSPARQP